MKKSLPMPKRTATARGGSRKPQIMMTNENPWCLRTELQAEPGDGERNDKRQPPGHRAEPAPRCTGTPDTHKSILPSALRGTLRRMYDEFILGQGYQGWDRKGKAAVSSCVSLRPGSKVQAGLTTWR